MPRLAGTRERRLAPVVRGDISKRAISAANVGHIGIRETAQIVLGDAHAVVVFAHC